METHLKRYSGPELAGDGRWRITVWAPKPSSVQLVVYGSGEQVFPMEPDDQGYWTAVVEADEPPRYAFRLDSKETRPDPCSHHQPEGVHGPSQAVDHTGFAWTDGDYAKPALKDWVLYELHVGAFTPEGTFDAAVEKIPHLLKLGINAVEVMPVNQCPGRRNWGYDGAQLYAVQDSFGGPEAFKRFVNACHGVGMAVVLDVVYNHLGPEGNYLREYGPYFTAKYKTPWGEAVNFDSAGSDHVRSFFFRNALHWFENYHVDGLRLDAVHAIYDTRPTYFLSALSEVACAWADEQGARRPVLIAETHSNDPVIVRPRARKGYGMDSMWTDDFHHSMHVLFTGEEQGFYKDFDGFGDLCRAVARGYSFDGRYSEFRGHTYGAPLDEDLPPTALTAHIQNHDMVGNRLMGERLSRLAPFEGLKAAAALMLFSPFLPMLFMGEEWGEDNPFLYFVHHGDAGLVEAVRKGRRREFKEFEWKGEPPDPQAEETFLASTVDWAKPDIGIHAQLLAFYRECIFLRKRIPGLTAPRQELDATPLHSRKVLGLTRGQGAGAARMVFNFGARDEEVDLDDLFRAPDAAKALDSANAAFGGPGQSMPETLEGQATIPSMSAALYADPTILERS